MKGRGAVIAKVLGGAPLGETAFGLNAAKKTSHRDQFAPHSCRASRYGKRAGLL